MNRWIKIAIVAAVVAIVVVVITAQRDASREAAWAELASARAAAFSVESLEDAREAAMGTDAEPWIVFHLTIALYRDGTPEDLARAQQVASASIEEYPDHALRPLLESVLETIKTYQTGS